MSAAHSRVLKGEAARHAGRLFQLADLQQQTEAQLTALRAELDRQQQAARQYIEQLRQQAVQEGYRAGWEQGQQAAQQVFEERVRQQVEQQLEQRLQSLWPALERAARDIHEQRAAWLSRWEQRGWQLALLLTEKLTRCLLQRPTEQRLAMWQHVLELAVGEPRLTIRLHPADLAGLGEQARRQVQQWTGCHHLEFATSEQLQPGECVVETAEGEIDARVSTMLARLAEELLDNALHTAEVAAEERP
ncbi:MAG: hypothetical protein KatS3mg114_0384 [Planctomycetaceae bacterium]|nr:MAG: hypothetical protein KatS3mg114_0384 [Planctomycetaceae bacterium]